MPVYFTKEHEWIRVDGDTATIGISDHAQEALGDIVFAEVPPNLRSRPTLVTKIDSDSAGKLPVELDYLTGGLSWAADYVAELAPDERSIELKGWVTLTNTSGTSYRNAKLQLVAGDVNRVRQQMVAGETKAMSMAQPVPAPMAEQALFEYHLYTLGRPTTIAESQTKQVELLTGHAIPVTKEYHFANLTPGYNYQMGEAPRANADVRLKFINTEKSGLGIPLPQGTVRVYKADNAGQAIFVGEDAIRHTPKNEYVDLTLGQAFDVTARGKQTDFEVLGSDVYESAYDIEFKNAKSEDVTVILAQTVPGIPARMLASQRSVAAAVGATDTTPSRSSTSSICAMYSDCSSALAWMLSCANRFQAK